MDIDNPSDDPEETCLSDSNIHAEFMLTSDSEDEAVIISTDEEETFMLSSDSENEEAYHDVSDGNHAAYYAPSCSDSYDCTTADDASVVDNDAAAGDNSQVPRVRT